ncbi:MAG: hypothetical protein ACXVCY_00805 [Pseudobdellovibrionaceae bacterium]
MKNFFAALVCLNFLFFSVAKANGPALTEREELVAVKRAADENVRALLSEIKKLKNSDEQFFLFSPVNPENPDCDHRGHERCVPHCSFRYNDGKCAQYTADFCGPNAACAANCTTRYNDGSCAQYGPDFCGPNASCAPHCNVRYNDGTCGQYGADICY